MIELNHSFKNTYLVCCSPIISLGKKIWSCHAFACDNFCLFDLLVSASKTYIGSVLFRASAFTGAKLASGIQAVIGGFGRSTVSFFWTDPRCRSSARTINIQKEQKKSHVSIMDCIAWRMYYSIGDWKYFNVTYQRLCMNRTTVYTTGFHLCIYVCFKDVSEPLESICYLGPHAWSIKENEIKQARRTNTQYEMF